MQYYSMSCCNNIVVNCVRHFVIIKFFKLYFIMNNRRCYFSHTKWLILHSPRTAIVRNLILINNLLIPTFNKIYKRSVNPCVFFFFFRYLSPLARCLPLTLAFSSRIWNDEQTTISSGSFIIIIIIHYVHRTFVE